jgi:hypothetical protein
MSRKNTKRPPGPFNLTLVSDSIQRTVFSIIANHPSGRPPELRLGPKSLEEITQVLIQLGATGDDLSSMKDQVDLNLTAVIACSTNRSSIELENLGFEQSG